MATSSDAPRVHSVVDLTALTVVEERGNRVGAPAVGDTVLRMCHDLVTPAVTIRHLAEALESMPELSQQVRRAASLIAVEADRISEICSWTFEAANEPRPVQLHDIVSECVDSVRTWFRGTVEMHEFVPAMVMSHRVPMLRLVSNLLDNACHAAGPGGTVTVRLTVHADVATLEIANTGAQLDPGLVAGSPEAPGPSTLGLRIVAGILEDHGGRLHVERRRQGGTSVQVLLPHAFAQ
jgi:signal transduction histidine kinase